VRVRASVCERRRIVDENGTFSYENFKIDNTNLNLNLNLKLENFKIENTNLNLNLNLNLKTSK